MTTATIAVTSPAFQPGGIIPKKHTADGVDISPALAWTAVPQAKSVTLICEDPDAPVGNWVHWVLYDLPPETTQLGENVPKTPSLQNGALQGVNDFRRIGYGGPAPPKGKPHRYFFRVYALDKKLGLPQGANRQQVHSAMQGHVIARGELMGMYGR